MVVVAENSDLNAPFDLIHGQVFHSHILVHLRFFSYPSIRTKRASRRSRRIARAIVRMQMKRCASLAQVASPVNVVPHVLAPRGRVSVKFRMQQEHMTFARHWNACLEQQGYLAAFQRAAFLAEVWSTFETSLGGVTQPPAQELKVIFDAAVSATLAKGAPAL